MVKFGFSRSVYSFKNWLDFSDYDFFTEGEVGGRENCYRKKAATVGQNGRLYASCNFFSF